jgi:GNAT superfamily N-acetyltransferase
MTYPSLKSHTQIKPFVEADLPKLPAIQPAGWNDVRPAFKYYAAQRFCRPLKAEVDRKLIGAGCAIQFGPTGWLAHLIVHPEYRRRGIGTAILERLIEHLERQGCGTLSLIATDAGYPLYVRAGFVEQAQYVHLERSAPCPVDAPPADVTRASGADWVALRALDRAVSGEDRSAFLHQAREKALVHKRDGVVTGFYAPGLGEGLVEARDPAAGRALLRARVAGATRVALPAENRAGVAFLTQLGFVETRRARRMVRGAPFPWQPTCLYSRIGGNLG